MRISSLATFCFSHICEQLFKDIYICLDLQKRGYRNLSYIPSD